MQQMLSLQNLLVLKIQLNLTLKIPNRSLVIYGIKHYKVITNNLVLAAEHENLSH